MGSPSEAFKQRAFVAWGLLLCGLSLPVTGIVNHFHGFAPLSTERHAWMAAHNAMGVLFVAFSVWHVALNRQALWNHVRGTRARVVRLGREVLLAGLMVVAVLALFVGHAFHAGH